MKEPLSTAADSATDVHARLVAIAAAATSPANALHSATHAVARALGADSCAILLRRKNNGLEPRTRFGPPSDPALAALEKALAEKALRDVRPVTDDLAGTVVLAVPIASINQAIGAIVVRRTSGSAFTAEETMRLSGVASQIVELVESARLIESIERGNAAGARDDEESEPAPSVGERILRGVAASPGIAIGVATFRSSFPRALVRRDTVSGGALAENARVRDAVSRTRNDLVHLQTATASEIGEEQALVFGAHLLLLNDPMLTRLVAENIDAGRSAAVAVEEAFDEITRRLRAVSDPYIRERIEDIEDLRSRLLGHLVGRPREDDIDARLVVSTRTTPSLVVELKARGAVGIASELGGSTSHGVLLARALGVPAVTGIEGLTNEVLAGDLLIVDGDEGRVVVRPTAETRTEYDRRSQAAERKRTEFVRYRDEPARTADGRRFELQANIALGADLAIARENRAEGIGLYRTEFPFIVRDALPTVDEQVRIYARAYEAFPDAPVTFRLLDLAGDKFVASRELGVSRDAFHGYRSIRILFDYPHVLRDQVQAFAIAAAERELRVLVPMVTSLEEIIRIKELVASSLSELSTPFDRVRLVWGAMIETPAASEIVLELAREVDFFSIGTNDLIQYSLVVDREDSRMASEWHAYHPAMLRVIRRVVTHAHVAGKRVTVCGEMAVRPDLAIALLALGVDGLSVTPRAIPELKQALSRVPLDPLRADLDGLLSHATAAEVATALRRYVRDGGAVGSRLARTGNQREANAMGANGRNINPEDEYFARREGEIERERDRREATRKELEDRDASKQKQPDDTQPSPSIDTREREREAGGASKIVGTVSTAVKALFGISGSRRRRHA